jgi:hypothetical protein
MNSWLGVAVALASFVGSLAGTAIVVSFRAGKIVAKVEDHERRLGDIEVEVWPSGKANSAKAGR